MKKLLLLLLCFSIFSLLQAQIDYIGPNPGTWNKASNWSSGKVPAYGDYVRILTGDSVEIKKGYHAQVKELEIEAGAGMLIRKGGSLTSDGAVYRPGVENSGNLRVFGDINIQNVATTAAIGLQNSAGATLIIKNQGRVIIEDVDEAGIWNDGLMANWGRININDCASTCFLNDGTFVNKTSGSMNLYDATSNCLNNRESLENHGSITCDNGDAGIRNSGTFQNRSNGTIEISGCDVYGIYNLTGGSFSNEGSVFLKQQNTGYSISNAAEVYNHECAYLEFEDSFYNYAGASIINSGWLVNTALSHTNNGTITNYGVIEDNPYSLAWKVTTNLGSMITPIAGPLVENVNVSNPLWVGSYDSLVVVGIYTNAAATNSAGTYTSSTYQYTPNAAAVGLATLYVKYTNAAGTCGYIFPIIITNPNRQGTLHQGSLSIYPNPCTSHLNIQLDPSIQGIVTCEIMDMRGRTIMVQNLDATENRINLPVSITSGMYMLRLRQGERILGQEKVVVE